MSVWSWIIHTPLADALGWALFHFVWEAMLIAAVLAGALYLLRPSSARVRYGLSCLAMLGMLAAFGSTLAWFWPMDSAAVTLPGGGLARAGHPDSTGLNLAPLPSGIGERLPLAVPFWAAGVLLFYLHWMWSWIASQRLRRVGTCAAPEQWQERLDRLADRLGVSRTIVLLESCLAQVPMVLGYLRPMILLPVGLLAGLPPEQVEAILIHELAHIRRHDYLVNLLQTLTEGLLFYHPAVWWVSSLIRTEREHCCDDLVVAVRGDAYGYAVALAALEQNRRNEREPALAATGGSLVRRIRRLLKQPEGPRPVCVPVLLSCLLLVSLGAGLAAWQPEPLPMLKAPDPVIVATSAQPVEQVQPSPAPARVPESPKYRKWLREDVAYIISDAERSAFIALQTGLQSEKFIEEFWLRRDPTPGTPKNEFKVEHYRRIAYANERFAAGIPGWKTDRGRTYITYGPPDEIESHPSGGGAENAPWEIWRYRQIEGVGNDVTVTFTDPSLTGEYRRTPETGARAKGSEVMSEIAVQVNPDRTVSISIPVNGGAKTVNVYGRITAQEWQPVFVFEDTVAGQAVYRKQAGPLAPGQHRLHVVTKIADSPGYTVANRNVDFSVN